MFDRLFRPWREVARLEGALEAERARALGFLRDLVKCAGRVSTVHLDNRRLRDEVAALKAEKLAAAEEAARRTFYEGAHWVPKPLDREQISIDPCPKCTLVAGECYRSDCYYRSEPAQPGSVVLRYIPGSKRIDFEGAYRRALKAMFGR